MEMQHRMNAAASQIAAAHSDGYAGIIAAPENHELRVYWKGQPPAAIDGLFATLRATVPIRVLPAAYSQKEMLAEANRIAVEPGVSSVAPNADGTGLSVSLRSTALVASAQLNTTMKVDRTYADPTSMSYSRENDIAPYYGGGDVSILGGDCSTGFAIWHAGVTSMLTAGHCANNGDAAYDGAFRFMGVVSGVDKAHDTAVINTPSAGRVWDGGAAGRGPAEFTKPVWGVESSWVGNWECMSGARSGAVCNIQIRAINVTVSFADLGGYPIYQQVIAEQTGHSGAAGNGDSGGPVFDLSADWTGDYAMGTITGGDSLSAPATCQGQPGSIYVPRRACSWRVYYADITYTLPRYNSEIRYG
jgi:hypothetical protein